MLGLAIISSAADNRENACIWGGAPNFDGVEFIHLFGRSLEQSVRNLAPGKPDATVVGTPEVYPDYLRGNRAIGFIQTRTRDWLTGTYIVVARAVDTPADYATQPMLIGTADHAAEAGSALYATTSTAWRQNAYFVNTEPPPEPADVAIVADNASAMKDWALLIGEFDPDLVALANMTQGDRTTTNPDPRTVRLLGFQNIGIMGNTGAWREGRCEVALAIGLSRLMVDSAERTAWRVAIQRLLTGTGISI